MPSLCLQPDHIFDGQSLRLGYVIVEDGVVVAIADSLSAETVPLSLSGTLSPGFLDLQVNGGGDVLLNTTPTPEGMAAIAAAHRPFGTTALMPTLITDAAEVLDRAADAALAAHGQSGILGLHIEGPHLAMTRRGTHAAHHLRPLDDRTLAVVHRLRAGGVAVLITLAPEAVSLGQIARLVAMGAVVSIGHSDATAEQTRAALAEGATCFTHLYNAMSPMLGRAPGVTGTCINSAAYAGIICDGIHVMDEMVALALRARPVEDTTFLVSDAMPTVGGSDHFRLYGDEIRLVNGRLINAEGNLAGAHVTMAESVARLVRLGFDPARVLRMATTVPARVIGRTEGLVGQTLRDLILLNANWAVTRVGLD
jgi:N-acetylglucosamine-6-phosphate deacetylase